jgi:hypothetical protein
LLSLAVGGIAFSRPVEHSGSYQRYSGSDRKENYVEVKVYSKKAANLTGQVGTDFIKIKPICIFL